MYYDDDDYGTFEIPEVDDIGDLDIYIDAEVVLHQNGEHIQAVRVIGQSKGPDGHVKGILNANPILKTAVLCECHSRKHALIGR